MLYYMLYFACILYVYVDTCCKLPCLAVIRYDDDVLQFTVQCVQIYVCKTKLTIVSF